MMGFGRMGSGAGGNSSSSTSNLSALATPFTVDRLIAKPSSNPNLQYSESPYTANTHSHGWEYSTPPAPTDFASSGMPTVSLPDNRRLPVTTTLNPSVTHWSTFSSSIKSSLSTFDYGSEVKPYYSSYVPALGEEESTLVEADGSCYNKVPTSGSGFKSQISYTPSLWNTEYETGCADNLGLDDVKWAGRMGHDGRFYEKPNLGGLHSYGNQLNQGGLGAEKNKKVSKEGSSGISNHIFNQAPRAGTHCGNSFVVQSEYKPCHEQDLGFFPYDSSELSTPTYKITCSESQRSVRSSQFHRDFSDDQNSSAKCVKPADNPFIAPVPAIMPSPTVVIRPPPASNGCIKQCTYASKPTRCDNIESVQSVNFGPMPNSQLKEVSSETSLFDIPGHFPIPPKELSTPLQSRDSFDRKSMAVLGSQLHDINICGGFNIAGDNNAQIVKSTSNSLEFVLDSPCWKGASCSSQFSTFDIEAGNSDSFKKNIDEYYGSNHEAQKNLNPVVDFGRTFTGEAGENNSDFEKHGSDAHCSSIDHSLLGDVKENKAIDELKILGKESVLANDLMGGFDAKISETRHLICQVDKMTTLNDVSVSDAGYIAVHSAEKVLVLPASREDANRRKMHVPTVLKAMHNLSELLMFHLSNESCSLEKEDTVTLEGIISNLNSCQHNKSTMASKKPELYNSAGDSSGLSVKLGEPCNVHIHSPGGDDTIYGKKDDKLRILPPLTDGLDVMSDNHMTKAIKKVLDENFHLNEEIHSEAVLFKNLWLDAEAKLCTIGYKARFDRMKIQMEQIRLKEAQDIGDSEGISSEACVSRDDTTAPEVGPHGEPIAKPISSTCGPTDSMEATVMARFNILKSREENSKPVNTEHELQKQPNKSINGEQVVAGPVVVRFDKMKSDTVRGGESVGMEDENQQWNKMSKRGDGIHHEYDPSICSYRPSLRRRESLCSDWEHV